MDKDEKNDGHRQEKGIFFPWLFPGSFLKIWKFEVLEGENIVLGFRLSLLWKLHYWRAASYTVTYQLIYLST